MAITAKSCPEIMEMRCIIETTDLLGVSQQQLIKRSSKGILNAIVVQGLMVADGTAT